MRKIPLSNILIASFCLWYVALSYGQTQVSQILQIKVHVGYGVSHPGTYLLSSPATMDQAIAKAGGWPGLGENGVAPHYCYLEQVVDGKTVRQKVSIHVDKKTKQITVNDPKWKEYQLADGDDIEVPIVMS